ncbi:tyrosine-type recombinase/integrase [Streptomyces sp. NPDC059256]|uniref:tyrosine-type recombinase/integrase n=1 Tax=Streptomyces sp. NPDC059256 TaxID=3346794 RepID=UPI0036C78A35
MGNASRLGNELINTDAKTEAFEAVLPLPDVCPTALWLRWQAQEAAEKATGEMDGFGFRVHPRDGTPIEPRNFNREFNRRCERAVRFIRVHDTRHTCASLLAALDVHPRIAMQILRHSEIAVTMEVYTHVPSAETRKALRKLGKALDGSKPKPKGKKIKKCPGGRRQS